MQQETPDELIRLQRQGLGAAVMLVVFVLKRDLAVFERDQSVIGDRDSMGIAAQIREHLLGAAEGRLSVDHPLGLAKRFQVGSEAGRVAQRLQFGEELEPALVESLLERLEEQAAKQAR